MKKYQIFISSTFEDLKEERRAATQQVLNMGHLPVGMELFQAGDVSQWEYIKRRIDECDYYIVVIGDKYGSLDPSGISYTEKEYRYAESVGMPVAAFLLSSEAIELLPKSRTELNTAKARKLKAFRERCKQKISAFWSNPHELAARISTSLFELFQQRPRAGLVRQGGLPAAAVDDSYSPTSRTAATQWIRGGIEKEFSGLELKATHIALYEDDPEDQFSYRVIEKIPIRDAFPGPNEYRIAGFEIFDVMRQWDIQCQPTGMWEVFQCDFEKRLADRYLVWRQSVRAKLAILDFDAYSSALELVKELEKREILVLTPDKELFDWNEYWADWSVKASGLIFAYQSAAGLTNTRNSHFAHK